MEGGKTTSPWVYVAIGCFAVVAVGVAAVAALGFMGYRWAKRMESDLKDPVARAAKVNEVLGAERLPEGYHPVISMSVPFVMDMAMLSDRPQDADHPSADFGQRGFMYFQMLNPQFDEGDARRYFEGRTDDPSALTRSGLKLRIRTEQVLRRGVFPSRDYEVMYLSQRGELDVDQARTEGLNTLMLVDCPDDSRMRMGIWFGPDPDPEAGADSPVLAGTPADENAIRGFMEHFRLCPS